MILDRKLKNMEYKVEKNEKAHCLECGEVIPYYRNGKHFCNNACRYQYHNRKKNSVIAYRTKVLRILFKNHEILTEMLNEGKTMIELVDLIAKGFQPYYCTGYIKIGGISEYHCFELRYRLTGKQLFRLKATEL